MHGLERGLASKGKGMLRVFVERVGEPFVTGVVSVGSDEHHDGLLVRDLQTVLPAVVDEIQV